MPPYSVGSIKTGEESCFLPYILGFLRAISFLFEGLCHMLLLRFKGDPYYGFDVPASVDHQQLRKLKKKNTHGLQTAGLEKSQVVHSEARWDQHMYKEVVTNVVESCFGILIWISTSSICCSHIWVGICSCPSFDVSSLELHKKFWHKRGGHVDFDIAQAWRKEPCSPSAVIPAEIFFGCIGRVPLPQDGACEVANSDQCNLCV